MNCESNKQPIVTINNEMSTGFHYNRNDIICTTISLSVISYSPNHLPFFAFLLLDSFYSIKENERADNPTKKKRNLAPNIDFKTERIVLSQKRINAMNTIVALSLVYTLRNKHFKHNIGVFLHHIPNTVNENNDFDLQAKKRRSTLLDARVELRDYENKQTLTILER